MDAITQGILNKSKLEVDLIKISNATKTSFVMSMKGKATKVGVMPATISAMTVDLVGPKGAFGRLDVPGVKMGAFGAEITILDQVVHITDMEAFEAFVRTIIEEETLILRLENGQATIKAMGMKTSITYGKAIHLRGLKNLKMALTRAENGTGGVTSVFSVANPSQFEMDLGTVVYEVRDENGRQIAEQTGVTHVKRGESAFTMTGPIKGSALKEQVQFLGKDVEEESWLKEMISAVRMTATVPSKFELWHI